MCVLLQAPWGANDTDDMTVLRRIAAHMHGTLRMPARVTLSSVDHLMTLLNQLIRTPAWDPNHEISLCCLFVLKGQRSSLCREQATIFRVSPTILWTQLLHRHRQ